MPPRNDDSFENEKIERLRRAMYSRSLSEHLGERERRELEPEKEVVPDDWKRDKGPVAPLLVAPRRMNILRTTLWWLLAIALIFFVGAIGFFVYYFSLGGGSSGTSNSNISIIVTGPPQIPSGEVTELQISITNNNSAPLTLSTLTVTYPPGTKSPADFSTPQLTYPIDLGTIEPGETKEGTVKAVFSGTAGEQSDVKLLLDYHLSNSNSIFTANSDYAFTFSSAPLSLAVTGPSQSVSGQPIQMTLNLSSNTTGPVTGVLLSAAFPYGFQFTSASPPPTSPGLWTIGTVNPGQTQTIQVNGVLTGAQGDNRVFNFTAGTPSGATSTNLDVPLAAGQFATTISQPFIGLSMAVNNATGSSVVVAPAQKVTVTVHYINNLSSPIQNAVVVAQLSGVPIDGTEVSSPDGFYRSNDNTVLWNQTTTNGALSLLSPGQGGDLTFTFSVPDSTQLTNVKNPSISISIDAAGSPVSESGISTNLQSVVDEHIAIASSLQLAANGLYYSSPYGSVGPLPPQAGIETTYAMVFTVTNTTNQIDNAVVTAVLPPYVRSTGKESPSYENVQFNNDTGSMTWNVGTIAPNVGVNGMQPRQVAFEVGFTPSTGQIGSIPVLLQNISLTGTDDATGQTVTVTAPNITTNLVGDTGFNAINATVVAPNSTSNATSPSVSQ
ncbi:MAG TPA: hypothetical protein VMU27_02765 [Candidatus Paceibacterota bacterium]|nr:hypothetical protein [Candidatus Paceibacterota bacterium]